MAISNLQVELKEKDSMVASLKAKLDIKEGALTSKQALIKSLKDRLHQIESDVGITNADRTAIITAKHESKDIRELRGFLAQKKDMIASLTESNDRLEKVVHPNRRCIIRVFSWKKLLKEKCTILH